MTPGRPFSVSPSVDDDGSALSIAPGTANDFSAARDGDHLVCLFECEYCVFERLVRRSAAAVGSLQTGSPYQRRENHELDRPESDQRLLETFRRANLDAFFSRSEGTVRANTALFARYLMHGTRTGVAMFSPPPVKQDGRDFGERCAMAMLLDSLEPGRDEATVKFSTVRKVRAMVTNVVKIHHDLATPAQAMRQGPRFHELSHLPTDSPWFMAFVSGMRSRMGERVRQDMAITPEIVVAVLELYETEWIGATIARDVQAKRRVAEGACFFVLTYAAGLRGFEVPKVVLPLYFEPAGADHPPYVGLPLTGYFKARGRGVVNILMFLVQETASGVATGTWLRRMVDVRAQEGAVTGWLFRDEAGAPLPSRHFNDGFFGKLEQVFDSQPGLFVTGVDILEDFGPTRSGRRGATTRATKMLRGDKDQLDWFFRWNTGGGETSSVPMRVLYAERRLLVTLFLHVSSVL